MTLLIIFSSFHLLKAVHSLINQVSFVLGNSNKSAADLI